ncbi:MAG: hypothetical protein ABI565_10435 [Vicinamibacteria bacterium]
MAVAASLTRREMWTCECGRKVPSTVEQCRCGKAKPVEPPQGPDLGGAADWVEQKGAEAAAKPSGKSYRGYQQLATVALVAGLFFGSRYFNQWRASRAARAELVNVLAGALGAEDAEKIAAQHHAACFEETYQIGWGRSASGSKSKFDAEQYVRCVAKRAKLDRFR